MASFLDTTFATSTVGADAPVPCEFAALAEAPRFGPQETHKPTLPTRTMFNRTSFQLIARLPARDSEPPAAGWRKRFGDPQDRWREIARPPAPEPWITPAAGQAESRRSQTASRRSQ